MTKRKTKPKQPAAPRYLGADAATLWRQTVAYLSGQGRLEATDGGVIETYCMAVARQRAFQAVIDREGVVMADGKPHPLLRTIEATAATVRNLAHVLGLSPLARKALPSMSSQPKGASVWDGVLGK